VRLEAEVCLLMCRLSNQRGAGTRNSEWECSPVLGLQFGPCLSRVPADQPPSYDDLSLWPGLGEVRR
jgi:hypothetical protein